MKAIPFIRAFPSGEKRLQEIERPDEIYALACNFIAHGGRYLVFINAKGETELVAALLSNEQPEPPLDPMGVRPKPEPAVIEAAVEKWPNGPGVEDAVDRLVRTSVKRLDSLQ